LNSGLLWEAIEIIQDIPEKKISLGIWQRSVPDEENPELAIPAARFISSAHKKLVCCPGGWLALHPDMQAAGLVANVMGTPSLAHWRDQCEACQGLCIYRAGPDVRHEELGSQASVWSALLGGMVYPSERQEFVDEACSTNDQQE
jgi:hypothetical protein